MELQLRSELLNAILQDDADEVRRLVVAGASLGPDPKHGNTPVRTACQHGAVRSLRVLLGAGAKANERITYKSPVDKRIEQDFTPTFYAESPDVIDTLVEYGADVNSVSSTGLTALMLCAHHGRSDLVGALLGYGADISFRQNKKRGRKEMNALELAHASLAFWESLPRSELKPEAETLIEAHRRTVEVLLKATAEKTT